MSNNRHLAIKNSYFGAPSSKSYQELSRFNQSQRKTKALQSFSPAISLPAAYKQLKTSAKDVLSGIFELYGVGINYTPHLGLGVPYGSGIQISANLILTTSRNLPTAEHALISILRFIQRPDLQYRLNPNIFFYSDQSKNLTICALSKPTGHPTKPIRPKSKFILFKNEEARILTPDLTSCRAVNILKNSFTFSSPCFLLPGSPIFSTQLKLQGIYTSDLNEPNIKLASRIDSLLEHLIQLKNMLLHPELEALIASISKGHNLIRVTNHRLGDLKDLFWIQKRSTSVFQYSLVDKSWNGLQIVNINEFKSIDQNWTFKEYSRVAYVSDGSLFIVGGMDSETSKSTSEVLQLYPSSGLLQKRASMQEPRSAHCLIMRHSFLYAIGGFPSKTCERYDLSSNKWEPISSLIYPRTNASAVLFNNETQIIVVGGDSNPTSIERYSFQFDKWELLNVLLPGDFVNPGVYLCEGCKMAILGGKSSELVVVFEADSYAREKVAHEIEEMFRVYTVDVLMVKLVCTYPAMFVWEKNAICFINERGSRPEVLEYSAKKFAQENARTVNEFKNVSKIRSNLPENRRLLTPSFVDMYY